MPAVVVDTHTIVWYLAQDARLSQRANDALDAATQSGEAIYVPAICLVELTYLVEKGRLSADARDRLIDAIDDPERPARLAPMDRAVVEAVARVSRAEVPDMPDRIVAATALALGLPVISRDARIRASQVPSIW